ncbi:CaiB/BaiF CoA transferase family protein [Robertmurraya andreesenii]|uniref:Crotonobetainyl-CoA:carnitine CoA-transferase CaiB-like acyl-CoA transferase n=1 Tax=Anoxybacillus andreesenii TaxID=1325932 RepID=A0ABT9V2B8_9BACL|nr:CoA transferase [Robertmurraya andreesenii]MDQ0155010.1 crotonobetainyl-CoA:carnitine CoA-transferase CaiB-like acyl-CoA transferase [Robertmurraya andreesenii]
MPKALEGVRVLGATRMLAGPYVEMLLADMGAEVLHIELPGQGDDSRYFAPLINGEGSCFIASNRNKKSITLDLRTEEGQEIFRELAQNSDIVVENNRPGTMDKWNIGYESLKEINPGIIMTSVSGFGQTGPYRNRAGLDIIAQAMGGLMFMTGQEDGPPTRVGNAMGDFLVGLYAVYGTLTALYYREKTGQGQHVDAALLDSVIAVLENVIPNYVALGKVTSRIGSRIPGIAPYNIYKAKDGYVVIGVSSNTLWERFTNVIGRTELQEDPRFATPSLRVKNVEELDVITQNWVSQKTVEETVSILNEAGVICGPVYSVDQMIQDPHVIAREMAADLEHPIAGKLKVSGVTPKLSLTPGIIETAPPTLGQHNEEVYKGLLGISEDRLKTLTERGVI